MRKNLIIALLCLVLLNSCKKTGDAIPPAPHVSSTLVADWTAPRFKQPRSVYQPSPRAHLKLFPLPTPISSSHYSLTP
jgi:hypothetical protein